ncbi:GPW/Gp25 family protein [Enterobacter cloacae]|nr:GPW/Gp25 family protein [Enterobacter cloacae]
MFEKGATSKMGKRKRALVYVLTVIIFLLIIPEIILRICTSEQLGRISDFTSLGGLLNPLLSLLIFLALVSIILAAIAIAFVKRIFRKK